MTSVPVVYCLIERRFEILHCNVFIITIHELKSTLRHCIYIAAVKIPRHQNYDEKFLSFFSFRLDRTMQDVVYKLVPGLQNSKDTIMCFHDVKLKIRYS